ncbi:cytochrome P450 [Alphaproteobacteria bacterium KMM 3653]|uniref:Cytochrome P450 n=1 Tax=Harenicola maris TaxID=2841044 RepID=A0AAP2CMZ3_9RHOB|nr:cytochrome P450 [Harenicola maris]
MPDLTHIPGPRALPVIGQTLPFLRDPYGTYFRNRDSYGEVFRLPVFGQTWVVLAGPDALEEVLMNRDGIYSAQQGLRAFAPFFSGGLLHRDDADHRSHRRTMQAAFRADVMRGYLEQMNFETARILPTWPTGRKTRFAPRAKALTLEFAARVFMGLTDPAQIARFNTLFIREVRGTAGILRLNLPFLPYGRGIRARAALSETFQQLITARRAAPGEDFFSQLCIAQDEDGKAWSDKDIADHFNFLLIAAHDAVTGTLTVMADALAQDQSLQHALRAEIANLPPGPLQYDDLGSLPLIENTMNEALRIHAPSAFTARRATAETAWKGTRIPAGTDLVIAPGPVMMDPALWPDPNAFTPARFTAPPPHKFAFAPFGGGAHKCIGMHFSGMQIKTVMTHLLRRYRITSAGKDHPKWRQIPTPVPTNGLPVTLTPL